MRYLFALVLILTMNSLVAQEYTVDTLQWTGSSDKRINLVILGDGYQEGELEQFSLDAKEFMAALFAQAPYAQYSNYFNVVTIEVPSPESGASHPGTATDVDEPRHPVSLVDNYFGSTFDAFGIHRLLVSENVFRILNVLADNFPTYDQVVVLVNSPYYGGSGGEFAVASLHEFSGEIAIHEMGHSFAELKDEYYAGDLLASEAKNMTKETDPVNVKWKNWVGTEEVGVHQHCCGDDSGLWYKPHETCMMGVLGGDLCPVCAEGTVETIHSFTSFVDSYFPDNSDVIDISVPLSFTLDLLEPQPSTLSLEWKLNGEEITNAYAEVTLDPSQMKEGNNQLTVLVTDTTAFLRVDFTPPYSFDAVLWNIESAVTSIDQITAKKVSVKLAPNPFQEYLEFNLQTTQSEDFIVRIVDVSGREIMSTEYDSQQSEGRILMGHLESGIYHFVIEFSNGLAVTKSILKD